MLTGKAWTRFRTCASFKILSLSRMWSFLYCLIFFSNSLEICKSETNQRWLIYFVQSQVPKISFSFLENSSSLILQARSMHNRHPHTHALWASAAFLPSLPEMALLPPELQEVCTEAMTSTSSKHKKRHLEKNNRSLTLLSETLTEKIHRFLI